MTTLQKKHKFNAVDAAIIIVIAAIIGAAAFFFLSGNEGDAIVPQTVSVEYVIEFRTIRDEFADNFTVGDSVVDAVALYRIGQIVAIDVTDATYTGTDMTTGEIVLSDYPDYSNVAVTVSADAAIGELGRYVLGGGYDLSVGSAVSVRTPNYTGTGYCTQIRQSEGGAQ